jgi:hypothetical protein
MKWIKTFEAQSSDEQISLVIENFFDFDEDWITAVLVDLEDLGIETNNIELLWSVLGSDTESHVPYNRKTSPIIRIEMFVDVRGFTDVEIDEMTRTCQVVLKKFQKKCQSVNLSNDLTDYSSSHYRRYSEARIVFSLVGNQTEFTWKQIFSFIPDMKPKLLGVSNIHGEQGKEIFDLEIGDKVILTAPRSEFAYAFLSSNSSGLEYLTDHDFDLSFDTWEHPDYHYDFSEGNQKKLIEVLRKTKLLDKFLKELGAEDEEQIFANKTSSWRYKFSSDEIVKALRLTDEDLTREIMQIYSDMLESELYDEYIREVEERFLEYATKQLQTKITEIRLGNTEYYRFEYADWMAEFRHDGTDYKTVESFIGDIISALSSNHTLKIYLDKYTSIDKDQFNKNISEMFDQILKK